MTLRTRCIVAGLAGLSLAWMNPTRDRIAEANRLPVINLTESAGADLPRQAEIFVPGGATFKELLHCTISTTESCSQYPTVRLLQPHDPQEIRRVS